MEQWLEEGDESTAADSNRSRPLGDEDVDRMGSECTGEELGELIRLIGKTIVDESIFVLDSSRPM